MDGRPTNVGDLFRQVIDLGVLGWSLSLGIVVIIIVTTLTALLPSSALGAGTHRVSKDLRTCSEPHLRRCSTPGPRRRRPQASGLGKLGRAGCLAWVIALRRMGSLSWASGLRQVLRGQPTYGGNNMFLRSRGRGTSPAGRGGGAGFTAEGPGRTSLEQTRLSLNVALRTGDEGRRSDLPASGVGGRSRVLSTLRNNSLFPVGSTHGGDLYRRS